MNDVPVDFFGQLVDIAARLGIDVHEIVIQRAVDLGGKDSFQIADDICGDFIVLLLLTQNAEHKVTQAELMREAWGAESEAENRALWTLISRLRKKLKSEESRLEISSLRGGGYLLEQL